MLTQATPLPSKCSTLVDLLRVRAREYPDVTFTFQNGRSEPHHLTYAELHLRALRVGAHLQKYGSQDERVLLLYQPSLDFIVAFFGCLYAGAVAVTAFPPRFNGNLDRLRAIVADARPKLGLGIQQTLSTLENQFAQDPVLGGVRWLSTNEWGTSSEADDSLPEPLLSGGDLALLQYTSGSTAAPKGVMLSHENLLHNSELIATSFGCTSQGIGVSWLPPYHDMGLIGGIVQPLYVGGPMILMSPLSFLQHPLRWLQTISQCTGKTTVVSGGPNFAYDLCVRQITDEQLETIDLSNWDLAFVGAEPIREETLRAFGEKFARCGFRPEAFYPCYGLAEATLIVSGGLKTAVPITRSVRPESLERRGPVQSASEDDKARILVANGQTLADQKIVIVNPETLTLCGPNEVGEIWVKGSSVAQGYWQRPEETISTFSGFLSESSDGPFLRTGDLGFLSEGELFVTGRMKDIIILEGRNHYPQDIELTVERCHPAIRRGCIAAFSVEIQNRERLVVMAEVERRQLEDSQEKIGRIIRQAVAESHDVRTESVVLLKAGTLPKTSSGKIQRFQCRALFLNGNHKKSSPRSGGNL